MYVLEPASCETSRLTVRRSAQSHNRETQNTRKGRNPNGVKPLRAGEGTGRATQKVTHQKTEDRKPKLSPDEQSPSGRRATTQDHQKLDRGGQPKRSKSKNLQN